MSKVNSSEFWSPTNKGEARLPLTRGAIEEIKNFCDNPDDARRILDQLGAHLLQEAQKYLSQF